MTKAEYYVGMPVHIKWDGVVHTNWVGYIRRINRKERIAEVGPESVLGSHLHVYELDVLVPTEFTRLKHPGLMAEIERLQRAAWTDDAKEEMRHESK